jgi:hypothetical protein
MRAAGAQNARGTAKSAHWRAPRRPSAGEDASEASGWSHTKGVNELLLQAVEKRRETLAELGEDTVSIWA